MAYSVSTGLWKTLKNGLIVLGPAIAAGALAFIGALPEDIAYRYSVPLGFAMYFIKNYIENRNR